MALRYINILCYTGFTFCRHGYDTTHMYQDESTFLFFSPFQCHRPCFYYCNYRQKFLCALPISMHP